MQVTVTRVIPSGTFQFFVAVMVSVIVRSSFCRPPPRLVINASPIYLTTFS